MSLYIGALSGTSMDGIDVGLVDVDEHKLIYALTVPYSESIKRQISKVLSSRTHTIADIMQLNKNLGLEFSAAINTLLKIAKTSASDIVGIGSHGQTIAHCVEYDYSYTLQLGCAHSIAIKTGIDVVADFRSKDLALGGHGAPLAPVYHRELFKNYYKKNLCIVNIGGIANVTFINDTKTIGYDCGPGNCLLDYWINKNHNKPFDDEGKWAKSGAVHDELLGIMLKDPYFAKNFPKSLGREYFNDAWLNNYVKHDLKPADLQATLLALTANTIANAIKNYDFVPEKILICGGGAHNCALMQNLVRLLAPVSVVSTSCLNIDPKYIETMLFAWLASRTLNSEVVDLREITGSKTPAIIGAIYKAS